MSPLQTETHRLFWSLGLEGRGDLETAQPSCSIIGFIVLASGQCFFRLVTLTDDSLDQSGRSYVLRHRLCRGWAVAARWAGLVKQCSVSLLKSLRPRQGLPPFPTTPQFTFGRARNGLLQFSQRPGRILRNVSFIFSSPLQILPPSSKR